MPTSQPLIYARMAAVMAAVGAISKDRNNEQQRYKFRGIDDAMNALHGPLAEAGVIYTAAIRDVKQREYVTKTGTAMLHITLICAYTFWAADGSCVTFEALGEASDSGDKAAGKAQAYALKVALLQVFCIPTEEQKDTEYFNPEQGFTTVAAPAAPRLTDAQRETIEQCRDIIKGTRSKVELRESWDSFQPWVQAVLKDESRTAAARIEAVILEAACTPAQ